MPFTNCLECKCPISDSALSCPGCSTREPFGVACELCGERLRRSTGITSVRRERVMERVSTEDYDWWSEASYNLIDRDIVAHKDCLERYYTPPSALECSDCGLRLSSSDLGFTALSLWSASRDELQGVSCPRCGKLCYFFHINMRCKWASSGPNSAYPCMKPLYSFQVGPHGHGHGPVPIKVIDNTDKKGGCFIATAVLNGEHTAQLAALYNFRNHFLMSSALGRMGWS